MDLGRIVADLCIVIEVGNSGSICPMCTESWKDMWMINEVLPHDHYKHLQLQLNTESMVPRKITNTAEFPFKKEEKARRKQINSLTFQHVVKIKILASSSPLFHSFIQLGTLFWRCGEAARK